MERMRVLVVDAFGKEYGPASARLLKAKLADLGYGSAKVEASGIDRDPDLAEKIANAHAVVHLFHEQKYFGVDIDKIKSSMTDGLLLSLSYKPTDLEYSRIAKEIIRHYEQRAAADA